MSEGGEIVGDIAQGGLMARAVEPPAGESTKGHTHEAACLNCGTALVGSHCHACGQAAHVHKTLAAFFHDLLHGVFHFEGKIWRTLPLLAWRPGRLTREYIDGRRASYVSPIALFLFVVFLTYAVFNALGNPIRFGDAMPAQVGQGFDDARSEAREIEADVERRLAQARSAGQPTAALERELKGAKMAVETIGVAQGGKLPDAIAASDDPAGDRWVETINRTWAKARANPELLLYKLQTNAYKYSWALIPLSVPLLWLLFPFSRRFRLYDHTVFVTYSISFMLILIAAFSLLVFFNMGELALVPTLYAPLHIYRQLKGTYGLSRGGALWRTAAVLWFAAIVVTVFATTVLTLVING